MFVTPYQNIRCYNTVYDILKSQRRANLKSQNSKCNRSKNLVAMTDDNDNDIENPQFILYRHDYPLSYGVPVRERYGSTLLPATREQHDQNCTQSH